MPIILGADGSPVPFGAVHHRLEADFALGAMPSWLTAVGTVTYTDSSVGVPEMVLASPSATVSALSTLSTTSLSLYAGKTRAAKITLEGMWLDRSDSLFTLGVHDSGVSRGARYREVAVTQGVDSTTPGLIERFGPTTGKVASVDYQVNGGLEYNRRRNLSFLLVPPTRECYVLEGDQEWAYRNCNPDMALSSSGSQALQPWVRISTSTANIVSLHVQRLILEWWN